MRKTNSMTLKSPSVTSQHGFVSEVKDLLNERNQCFSEICSVALTHGDVAAFFSGSASIALSLVCFSDSVMLYGWSAFLFLLGILFMAATLKKVMKGSHNE